MKWSDVYPSQTLYIPFTYLICSPCFSKAATSTHSPSVICPSKGRLWHQDRVITDLPWTSISDTWKTAVLELLMEGWILELRVMGPGRCHKSKTQLGTYISPVLHWAGTPGSVCGLSLAPMIPHVKMGIFWHNRYVGPRKILLIMSQMKGCENHWQWEWSNWASHPQTSRLNRFGFVKGAKSLKICLFRFTLERQTVLASIIALPCKSFIEIGLECWMH